jgi:Ca-activated chloride channel family protein
MNMETFSSLTWLLPWAFILLPVPWLIRLFLPAARQQQTAAFIPFAAELPVSSVVRQGGNKKIQLFIAALIWLLAVAATARPEWYGEAIKLPVTGRDLVLAVDISGSMQTEDFELSGRRVDRLTATKVVASAFIEAREGDRIGLILFGSQAFVQTPLTFDRKTVQILLDESVIGLAGTETAIGDAIGLAVKRLQQSDEGDIQTENSEMDQVLILLTDGVNTAGVVPPKKAAELAQERGLTIYTIGIGADAMTVRSMFGQRRVNPSAQLDEKVLTAIAEQTGGRYFRARDTKELIKIYSMIDQLEPVEREKKVFRPRSALFMWPLSLALLLSIGLMVSILPWTMGLKQKWDQRWNS